MHLPDPGVTTPCAHCGAALPPAEASMRRCGTCGALPRLGQPRDEPETLLLAAQSVASLASLGQGTPGKVCDWCGAANAPAARRCIGCSAVFPMPEQDAALLHASEERIGIAMAQIELHARMRERRRSWWRS